MSGVSTYSSSRGQPSRCRWCRSVVTGARRGLTCACGMPTYMPAQHRTAVRTCITAAQPPVVRSTIHPPAVVPSWLLCGTTGPLLLGGVAPCHLSACTAHAHPSTPVLGSRGPSPTPLRGPCKPPGQAHTRPLCQWPSFSGRKEGPALFPPPTRRPQRWPPSNRHGIPTTCGPYIPHPLNQERPPPRERVVLNTEAATSSSTSTAQGDAGSARSSPKLHARFGWQLVGASPSHPHRQRQGGGTPGECWRRGSRQRRLQAANVLVTAPPRCGDGGEAPGGLRAGVGGGGRESTRSSSLACHQ